MPNDLSLYDYQRKTVDWLAEFRDNQFGFTCQAHWGLIGHEMGLGKTAIALEDIKEMVKRGKRFLLLVPGATIIQWQRNWDRWVLDCEASEDDFGIDGLHAIRSSAGQIPRGKSVITSHNLLAKVEIVKKLAESNFDGIIIDEIHKFGSLDAKRVKHLWALINLTESKFEDCRIGLSGTPVRNYAKEIYNVAHFLGMPTARNIEMFSGKYLTFDRKALWNPQQFHSDFAPYYLRYTSAEVQKDLPEIRRTKLYTEITDPFIRTAYNKNVKLLDNFMNNAHKVDAVSLLGYLVKLRHITGIAKAKEPAIIEPIMEYMDEGNKVVLGIHHHFVADRLRKSLRGYDSFLMRGGMNDIQKENEKQRFISHPDKGYLMLSIKAAGEGVDGLQYASRKAFVFERQWNGADEQQFEKRIHRTGQTQKCHIETTIAAGTVDEFFDDMCEYKDQIRATVDNVDYENDPRFLRKLAEKVVANPLREPSYSEQREFESMLDDAELDSGEEL